jgi:putative peptide zinc metalloprotease protein
VAAPTSLPKLRHDLLVAPLVQRGEACYLYRVAETLDYYRLDELQHRILSLLDGTRSRDRVVSDFNAGDGKMSIDVEFLGQFVEAMGVLNIFEKSPEEKKRLFLEKVRDQRRATARKGSAFGNLLDIKLSAWNPDQFFERVIPRLRFIWTPDFVAISAACMLVMLGIWMTEWPRLMHGTIEMFTFRNKSLSDLVEFFVILLIIGFFHESAHGLTCKYFGGQVPRMGFMLIYFTPCFFVDVTDALMFDRHSKRQWTIFAGGYVELFLCALATFVWVLTDPGSVINDWCYKFMLLTGISSVVINYNPLIKLDGYYALMDYLEIADLWERSFAYVGGWIKKTIFRLPVDLESPTRRVRAIFFGYCLASVAYKVLLITTVLGFLRNVFVGMFGDLGYPALVLAGLVACRKWIFSLGRFLKFTFLDKKEALMKPRTVMAVGGLSALLLTGLLLLPVPITIRGPFSIEPRMVAMVRPSVAGSVEEIFVREGMAVSEGDALAVLRNDRLAGSLAVLSDRQRSADQEVAEAAQRGDRALLARKVNERDLVLEQVRVLRKEQVALTLRSPMKGVVTTPRLADLRGSYLSQGQTFCSIAGADGLVARVSVRDRLLEEITAGQAVDLKTVARPFNTLSGRVLTVAPASTPGEDLPASLEEPSPGQDYTDFDVIVEIDGNTFDLREGMVGRARIHLGRFTPAIRMGRGLFRWFKARVW